MRFLSIDSSMNHTGIAVGEYVNSQIIMEAIELFEPEHIKSKQVRASSDSITRGRQNYEFLKSRIDKYKPQVIFAETPSGSQSSAGMKSYGMTCQLLAVLYPTPIEVTPQEVKIASVNDKAASKEKIISWAHSLYSDLKWYFYQGKLQAKNEHMADAIAIIYAGVKTNDFKRLLSLYE